MDRRQAVLDVIATVCKTEVSKLKPQMELVADLGIDSPKALHLLLEIEDRLGVEIEDGEAAELRTVGDILTAIER